MFWPQVLSRSGTDHQRQTFAELLNIELAQQSNTDGFKGQNKDFVLLRGVPYSATPEDVITFFGDLKSSIAHQGVRMVLNAVVGGASSGQCFDYNKSSEILLGLSEVRIKAKVFFESLFLLSNSLEKCNVFSLYFDVYHPSK